MQLHFEQKMFNPLVFNFKLKLKCEIKNLLCWFTNIHWKMFEVRIFEMREQRTAREISLSFMHIFQCLCFWFHTLCKMRNLTLMIRFLTKNVFHKRWKLNFYYLQWPNETTNLTIVKNQKQIPRYLLSILIDLIYTKMKPKKK